MTTIEQHELKYLPLSTQDDGKLKLNTTGSMSRWKTKGVNVYAIQTDLNYIYIYIKSFIFII